MIALLPYACSYAGYSSGYGQFDTGTLNTVSIENFEGLKFRGF